MNRLLSLLGLLLLANVGQAAPTSIATLPLLNTDGTGTVKPNLMLLYDNSGSMGSNFTPDYVDDSICRSRATLAAGRKNCQIGDPPFASAGFNRQYYNPAVRYLPPVTANGESYKSMTSANTSTWTKVPTDVYGYNETNLQNVGQEETNLVSGFPDIEWCDTSLNDCVRNTVGYTYPNAVRYTGRWKYGTPYYYSINVAEYCTDATLTTCTSTVVGAAAPVGYPIPAPVRWCNSTALTTCQAKYVGAYKYPRFGDPSRATNWYGTILIKASATTNRTRISSVQLVGQGTSVALTSSEVFADNGTDTAAKQAEVANALAASIVNKKSTEYTACVSSPTRAGVPACSEYGIVLESNAMVAIVPISCDGSGCRPVVDGSRAGRDPVVAADPTVTALLTITGKAGSGGASKLTDLSSLTLGTTQLLSKKIIFASGASASAMATALAKNITEGNSGIAAYVGNTGSPACLAAPTNTLCLVSTQQNRVGQTLTVGPVTNKGDLAFTQRAAALDGIPTTSVGLSASAFKRTDIKEDNNVYPRAIGRTDCAGNTCTYQEEMTNFANWYAYYKTRNQMMKTSVGLAFRPITDGYKVGIVSLSTAAAQGTINGPEPFVGRAREDWYKALYNMTGNGATPLRQALHSVGMMYANQGKYKRAEGQEVIKLPCQQNFTFLTTDGYWNGPAAADVVSNDNKADPKRFCSLKSGCVDERAQSANSLADIALYWYNGGSNDGTTSLRPSLENWKEAYGKVAGGQGENTRLHMNTYTLGLGVDGVMTYQKNYENPESGSDFDKLIQGVATGCPWNNNGKYVWPDPVTNDDTGGATYQSRVDDLWHAAINGHGKYFSASEPLEVVSGLSEALSHIKETIGAASAAATSTPNVSMDDNNLFAATFTTVKWLGELQSKKIDVLTGKVSAEAQWSTSALLGGQVEDDSDKRTIYMFDTAKGADQPMKAFDFALMNEQEAKWFIRMCADNKLDQCSKLKSNEREIVDSGDNLVRWIRGQQQYADGKLFRAYPRTAGEAGDRSQGIPIVLGDIASSKPAYMRDPRKDYPAKDYNDYKKDKAERRATVFVGANDGMLHAFDAEKGNELWAYVPRITMSKLYRHASTTYGTNHQFTVDGSPEVADVKINGTWRTVLVAGLNAGGRGYYALDVTDPLKPKQLWEICADKAVCPTGHDTAPELKHLGLTFGNPQIGVYKDGTSTYWAAFLTSGYNNIPGTDGVATGDGGGWLYVVDIATGKVLTKKKTPTGGDTTTPAGLARITAISPNPHTDPLVTHVFGGDNLGQMWRFDFSKAGEPAVLKMGDAGPAQPITTRPDVTNCKVGKTTRRVVAFGTGRLLDRVDIDDLGVQGAYVLADRLDEAPEGLGSVPAASLVKQQLSTTEIAGVKAFAIDAKEVDLAKSTVGGWYMHFDQNKGERVNLDPKIVDGVLNIVTNVPSAGSTCDVGGTSNVYQVDVCTGEPKTPIETTDAEGKPKTIYVAGQTLSNNAAAVGSIVVSLANGERRQITTNADGSIISTRAVSAIPPTASISGWRRLREGASE